MVCWNLLAANLLRIMFWFGHPFELPLLAQSILMVGVMMILIHACVDLTFHPTPRKVGALSFSRHPWPLTWNPPPRILFEARANFPLHFRVKTYCWEYQLSLLLPTHIYRNGL